MLSSIMGQNQSADRDDVGERDQYRSDYDNAGKINLEASPEIRIMVLFEQPFGTGLQMHMTVDPSKPISALKADLCNLTKVPVPNIDLKHHNNALVDATPMREQDINPNTIIVFRDSRLKYEW